MMARKVDPNAQALQDSVLFSQYLPSKDQAEIRLNLALKTKLAPQRWIEFMRLIGVGVALIGVDFRLLDKRKENRSLEARILH